MSIEDSQIRKQSEAAYGQWAPQWREQAKIHSRFAQKSMLDFQNYGIGKAVVAVANGYSLEENIETLKQYQDNVDIFCVDKCLVPLLERGIKPKFVLVCDANVDYDRYMKPVENQLSDITLFANVCANPKWTASGNWKDIRFFVNMDVLKSEREFSELSGCKNFIAAGTNVSNALLVILTQCDNNGPNNFFGYDKILMLGFDYCWTDKSYYAFDRDGGGKANYMKTVHCFDIFGNFCFTSSNLLFSAKWADKYISTFNIQAIQCGKQSLLRGSRTGLLEEQIQYKYKPEDSQKVKDLLQYRKDLQARVAKADHMILDIGRDHYKQVIRTT